MPQGHMEQQAQQMLYDWEKTYGVTGCINYYWANTVSELLILTETETSQEEDVQYERHYIFARRIGDMDMRNWVFKYHVNEESAFNHAKLLAHIFDLEVQI